MYSPLGEVRPEGPPWARLGLAVGLPAVGPRGAREKKNRPRLTSETTFEHLSQKQYHLDVPSGSNFKVDPTQSPTIMSAKEETLGHRPAGAARAEPHSALRYLPPPAYKQSVVHRTREDCFFTAEWGVSLYIRTIKFSEICGLVHPISIKCCTI